MKKAINTRPVTIYVSEDVFKQVKQITDKEMISFAEWFRAAANLKLELELELYEEDTKDDE